MGIIEIDGKHYSLTTVGSSASQSYLTESKTLATGMTVDAIYRKDAIAASKFVWSVPSNMGGSDVGYGTFGDISTPEGKASIQPFGSKTNFIVGWDTSAGATVPPKITVSLYGIDVQY